MESGMRWRIAVTVVLPVALSACEDTASPSGVWLTDPEKAYLEEIIIEAAIDGIWVATQSAEGGDLAAFHVGLAHSLPGVFGGLLAAVAVAEPGVGPVTCSNGDGFGPPAPYYTCAQLTVHSEGWAEGVVYFTESGEEMEGSVTFDSEPLAGELRHDEPPSTRWTVDFRVDASPAVHGELARSFRFIPSQGPTLDLTHEGVIEVSSLDPEESLLNVTLSFPHLHDCGTIIVQMHDDGHDVTGGVIVCGSEELGSVVADEELLFAVEWSH